MIIFGFLSFIQIFDFVFMLEVFLLDLKTELDPRFICSE